MLIIDQYAGWSPVSVRYIEHPSNPAHNRLVGTLRNFFKSSQGQQIIEYTLQTAFIALASAAMLITVAGSSIQGILAEISKH